MAKTSTPAEAPAKTSKKPKTVPKYWVGLGSSAGGLEALRSLAAKLPLGLDATFIVAQHMAPHFKSMLAEIIGRETQLEVVDIEDGMVPQKDHIYIIPPNRNVVISGGKLMLQAPSNDRRSPNPSVDLLFTSLAEAKGKNAVGMVLSGTGSDGAKGIRAIHEAGGIAIAQDVDTAKYSSMPGAAVDTGCVNLHMSPAEAGTRMSEILENAGDLTHLTTSTIKGDPASKLMQLLLDKTDVDFRLYKTATFERRVERRIAATDAKSLMDYTEKALASSSEVEALFKDLLISVTSFFRDPEEFMAIENYVRKLVETKDGEQIRVWVAGTATGEEAYSLAILFAEAMGGLDAFEQSSFQMFATDVDTDALSVARNGYFPEFAFDEVSDERLAEYFDRSGAGYTVKPGLREKITFSNHNIAKDPPFMRIDMVSCRNLLIYFQTALQEEVYSRFHYALTADGLLFLGRSEAMVNENTKFRAVDGERHIYRQRPSQGRTYTLSTRTASDGHRHQSRTSHRQITQDRQDLATALAQLDSLVSQLGDCAILVDIDMKILRAYGDLDPYVSMQAGAVDSTAMSLLKEPHRHDLRAVAPSVIRNGEVQDGISRTVEGKPEFRQRMRVYPIRGSEDSEVLALAVFRQWHDEALVQQTGSTEEPSSALVAELSDELRLAKANLRVFAQELEESNEELQSMNEELQSTNEELQSANEELETSNEELQSTNEELSTVNEELHVNAQQLQSLHRSLNSILANVGLPLLVFDRDLVITHMSDAAKGIFELPSHVATPHASQCKVPKGCPDLTPVLTKAIENQQRVDFEVSDETLNGSLIVVPNKDNSGEIHGAIAMLVDNTTALTNTRRQLEAMLDHVPIGIVMRGAGGVTIRSNEQFANLVNIPMSDLVGMSFYDTVSEKYADIMREQDEHLLKTGEPVIGVEMQAELANGTESWVRLSKVRTRDPETDEYVILVVAEDISEMKEREKQTQMDEFRLQQAIAIAEIGIWDSNLITGKTYRSDQFKSLMEVTDVDNDPDIKLGSRVHPEDQEEFNSELQSHLEQRTPFISTSRVITDTGRQKWVESHLQAFWDGEGKPYRIIGAIKDVTSVFQREAELHDAMEELSRSNEELNRFSYVCSHDMKEPVRMIESMADLLTSEKLKLAPEKQADLLDRMSNNAGRLRGIIDSLLAYSRIDAKVDRSDVDLNKVLADIRESLILATSEKSAEIVVEKLPTVKGASVHFTQLFQNLIGNALKFNDKEKAQVKVSSDTRSGHHIIVVADNGPGIPEDSRKSVFDLFSRLHRRDEVEGTGLGLSIAQRVVVQYGGKIRCIDSELGGAAFEITWPT